MNKAVCNANADALTEQRPVDGNDFQDVFVELRSLSQKLDQISDQLAGTAKAYYTVDEFGQLAGRSDYTVRRWVKEGRIDAVRVKDTGPKGRLLIPQSEVERLIGSGQGSHIPTAALAPSHIAQVAEPESRSCSEVRSTPHRKGDNQQGPHRDVS